MSGDGSGGEEDSCGWGGQMNNFTVTNAFKNFVIGSWGIMADMG